MRTILLSLAAVILFAARPASAQRINQDGRILGTLPAVTNSILFDTTNADNVVAAMQIFPVTSPYNEIVSSLPLLSNSAAMMGQIYTNFTAGGETHLFVSESMDYVLVPTNQPLVPINMADVPDSDLNGGTSPYGLYPIPTNLPVEPWPLESPTQTVEQWQTNTQGGDDDAIMVEPGTNTIWETYQTMRAGTNWQANNGAMFNLNTNQIRGIGLEISSASAAGLAIFPTLVRYDECERGMVEHACYIYVAKVYGNGTYGDPTTYIYPATATQVTDNNNVNYPKMGQRLRLQASFVISNSWTVQEKALLLGLKKYGAFVADDSIRFYVAITADDRWPANAFSDLVNVSVTNFEVVQSTGVNGGPRSPGAPVANAGPAQSLAIFQTAQLRGVVSFSNTPPAIQWYLYSGPGTVTFGNTALTNTTATFSTPGVYTLMLSAADGVHAVAYSAVAITVTNAIKAFISRTGTNANVSWIGGSPPFVLESATGLPASSWSDAATTSAQNVSLPITNTKAFFRVVGQ